MTPPPQVTHAQDWTQDQEPIRGEEDWTEEAVGPVHDEQDWTQGDPLSEPVRPPDRVSIGNRR